MTDDHPTYGTSLGVSDLHTISLLGRDLSADLIGRVSFGHLAFQLITLEEPTPQQARVFEAVLVALADHGFTPTAISARMTYLSAPESIQGALASGLLGGGSRFLGVSEDTGRFLADALAELDELPTTEAGWDAVAADAVRAQRAAGRFVPGLGHHLHKEGDPRTPVLFAIAREEGQFGPHLALFEAVGRVAPEVTGKALPLNGAGACGAALADIGIPIELLRGVVLLARCAGLLGHIAEEVRGHRVAAAVFADVERHAVYVDPTAADE
ncbi:citryl-CoA lyase [Nocardioides mangrovi]|uniref:citrate synthase (unknown stereospecificity) n=1 Tax=Nocardioides mangrovi TaxID=2874580 RepID=A0ABS7UAA1_9ACTN|nr:citryl-CoA lyase [Nocardioides mangrovi]MBZ5737914.1 citryl-CoA lyase [Nocardioides mangrovi]